MKQESYTILIADDSETQLNITKEILINSDSSFSIIEATNGEEAFDKAYNYQPAIILIDYEMPIMNGVEALRLLKKTPKTKDIPVIMLTGKLNIQDAFDAGALDFLKKPFGELELIARVNSTIQLVKSINEIKSQKQEIENHRDLISRKNREIMEDIRYSSLIQRAILPEDKIFKDAFCDHLIFNKPKNIVGGDFYWIHKHDDTIIIAASDCTGHGVSGALMHMMGNVFLNEIVIVNKVEEPNEILFELRKNVIRSLRKTGADYEMKDGMDIAVCVINKKTMKLKYSGANNPIYILKNNELMDIKPDRMPIGIHDLENEPFNAHSIKIEENDAIYMFSDGYADQFGGERGKKFRYQRFKDLLLMICQKDMKTQEEDLERVFNNWKGDLEQVDDILVIGFKV